MSERSIIPLSSYICRAKPTDAPGIRMLRQDLSRTVRLATPDPLLNQKERVSKRGGRDTCNGEQRDKGISAAVRVNPNYRIRGRVARGHREPAISARRCARIAKRIEQRPQVNAIRVARACVEPVDRVAGIGHRRIYENIVAGGGCRPTDIRAVARADHDVSTRTACDGIVSGAAVDNVIAVATENRIVSSSAINYIVPVIAIHFIRSARRVVVARLAHEHVVTVITVDSVAAES